MLTVSCFVIQYHMKKNKVLKICAISIWVVGGFAVTGVVIVDMLSAIWFPTAWRNEYTMALLASSFLALGLYVIIFALGLIVYLQAKKTTEEKN